MLQDYRLPTLALAIPHSLASLCKYHLVGVQTKPVEITMMLAASIFMMEPWNSSVEIQMFPVPETAGKDLGTPSILSLIRLIREQNKHHFLCAGRWKDWKYYQQSPYSKLGNPFTSTWTLLQPPTYNLVLGYMFKDPSGHPFCLVIRQGMISVTPGLCSS